MSSQVGLNPLMIVIAMVAGATLNGIIGMLLAIPLAAALQVIFQHVWVKPAIESLPLAATQAEDEADEADQGDAGAAPALTAVPVADENSDGIAERVLRPASSAQAADNQAAREAAAATGRPLPDISEEEAVEPEAAGLPTPKEILAVHAPAFDTAAEAARAEAETETEVEVVVTTSDELPTPEAILAATAVLEEEEAARTDEHAAVLPADESSLPESAPGAEDGTPTREKATLPAAGRDGKA